MVDRSEPRAGGFIIAVSVMAGAFAGGFANQPTIGLLAGFVVGCAIALLIWWRDRARR